MKPPMKIVALSVAKRIVDDPEETAAIREFARGVQAHGPWMVITLRHAGLSSPVHY
jgi:hypothetical protein